MPKARSAEADEILERATSVVISDLTVAEFRVSLARRLKLGELLPSQVEVVPERCLAPLRRDDYREFVAEYREASVKYRAGDRLAQFPAGSFPPPMPYVE